MEEIIESEFSMKRRHNPIRHFNSVDAESGYAIRFSQARDRSWSAVTTATPTMTVLGDGDTLAQCRQSMSDGIRGTLEYLLSKGKPITEPQWHEVPLDRD